MASFYLLKDIIVGFEIVEIGRVGEMDKESYNTREVKIKYCKL